MHAAFALNLVPRWSVFSMPFVNTANWRSFRYLLHYCNAICWIIVTHWHERKRVWWDVKNARSRLNQWDRACVLHWYFMCATCYDESHICFVFSPPPAPPHFPPTIVRLLISHWQIVQNGKCKAQMCRWLETRNHEIIICNELQESNEQMSTISVRTQDVYPFCPFVKYQGQNLIIP